MKKIPCLLLFLLLLQHAVLAQSAAIPDTSKTLDEVVITSFELSRTKSTSPVNIKVISSNNADRNNKTSLVNGFNSVAGVRMEERSPGSYRINIRGSSLRSPFGVRNVKVYWNDIPITDPGGNTYFNQFAFNNFSSIEVTKGPAGSMYGAGTGGLLLMRSLENSTKPSYSLEYVTGSYGLQNILASVGFGEKNNKGIVTYAHNQSDGYRDHTFSRKDNASFVTGIKISDRQQLTAAVLFNNMYYETPGGLNLAEYNTNPKQARPAAGGQPSAVQAKAAIYQENFTAGIHQVYHFTETFKNSTSLYGAFAQVKNPTFRNYERRIEPSFGGRTSFIYDKKIQSSRLQLVGGGEWQEGFFNTQVSKNKAGNPDSIQTNDDIHYLTYSLFLQADLTLPDNWFLTAGASINKSTVTFSRLNKYPVTQQGRTYKNEVSPRIQVLKKFTGDFSVFGTIAKGFSPPSIAELLPSTGVISTFLEAEEGTNYEIGGRIGLFNGKLQLEGSWYYFRLNNALVTRKDSSNADYYVNAGNTKQHGIEFSANYIKFYQLPSNPVDYINIRSAYTYSHYIYGSFQKGTVSYDGHQIPSVPKNTVSILADIQFKIGLYVNTTYYGASAIYLDDANTAKANAYHLLGARIGWQLKKQPKWNYHIYVGADNLLDENHSLGNDINAAAGRYYNAAPKRNYYLGIAIQCAGTRVK